MQKQIIDVLSISSVKYQYFWDWDNWFKVAEIPLDKYNQLKSNRGVLKYLRDELGLLSDFSKGKVSVQDDQHNLVIVNKNTKQPLFAIIYGAYV